MHYRKLVIFHDLVYLIVSWTKLVTELGEGS